MEGVQRSGQRRRLRHRDARDAQRLRPVRVPEGREGQRRGLGARSYS